MYLADWSVVSAAGGTGLTSSGECVNGMRTAPLLPLAADALDVLRWLAGVLTPESTERLATLGISLSLDISKTALFMLYVLVLFRGGSSGQTGLTIRRASILGFTR